MRCDKCGRDTSAFSYSTPVRLNKYPGNVVTSDEEIIPLCVVCAADFIDTLCLWEDIDLLGQYEQFKLYT